MMVVGLSISTDPEECSSTEQALLAYRYFSNFKAYIGVRPFHKNLFILWTWATGAIGRPGKSHISIFAWRSVDKNRYVRFSWPNRFRPKAWTDPNVPVLPMQHSVPRLAATNIDRYRFVDQYCLIVMTPSPQATIFAWFLRETINPEQQWITPSKLW